MSYAEVVLLTVLGLTAALAVLAVLTVSALGGLYLLGVIPTTG